MLCIFQTRSHPLGDTVVFPMQGMEQLKPMHGLARMVDDRLRSYGAAGRSLVGPDDINDLVVQAREQEQEPGSPHWLDWAASIISVSWAGG